MTTAHHPPSDLPIPPYLATEGRRPGASSGTGPGEIELVLMCLDYLRDLRRSHRAEGGSSSLANRGIDADWLSLSIYSLSRTLRPDTDLGSAFQDPDAAGNDPFFDPTSPAMMKSKQAALEADVFTIIRLRELWIRGCRMRHCNFFCLNYWQFNITVQIS